VTVNGTNMTTTEWVKSTATLGAMSMAYNFDIQFNEANYNQSLLFVLEPNGGAVTLDQYDITNITDG